MRKITNSPLFIVIFTIFLDSLGFGILIPIVPLLFANPSSNFYILSPNTLIKTGYILLGLITAIFPLMQFFSTSILGQLSDKYGRKPILQYTLFITSIAYLLFAAAIYLKNIPLLFLSRAMAGISAGNISAAQASIADLTPPQERSKNFGLIGAAFGLGFIIGPFLGGKLSDPTVLPFFNPTVPFYFASILSLLNAISVKTFYQETNQFLNRASRVEWYQALNNILKALKFKDLRLLFIVNFLIFSGFTFFVTFFSVFLIKKFGFTQGNIGDFFSFIGLCILLTQSILIRQVANRWDESHVLRVGIIAEGVFIGLMYFATKGLPLYFLAAGFAIFNGLIFANLPGLISRLAGEKIQGEILGVNASIQALAQLIPPILSGFIAAEFAPETPTVVASVIIIFAGILFIAFYKPSAATDYRSS